MRTCDMQGCDKKHRAKGLCATHYNREYCPDRHAPIVSKCTVCSVEVKRSGGGAKGGQRRPVCSDRCRYFVAHGKWPMSDEERAAREAEREARRAAQRARKLQLASIRNTRPPRFDPMWVECGWCADVFVAQSRASAYCSRACKRRASKARRRACEANATGTYTWGEVMRVYVKIGGCAYCGKRSSDIQPDHVIPLSRGGSNSITNIVPACALCNADKRDLSLSEWAADRERRGLEPRAMSAKVTHLTHAILAA